MSLATYALLLLAGIVVAWAVLFWMIIKGGDWKNDCEREDN